MAAQSLLDAVDQGIPANASQSLENVRVSLAHVEPDCGIFQQLADYPLECTLMLLETVTARLV